MKSNTKEPKRTKRLELNRETIRDLSVRDLMSHEGASTTHQGSTHFNPRLTLNPGGSTLRFRR